MLLNDMYNCSEIQMSEYVYTFLCLYYDICQTSNPGIATFDTIPNMVYEGADYGTPHTYWKRKRKIILKMRKGKKVSCIILE